MFKNYSVRSKFTARLMEKVNPSSPAVSILALVFLRCYVFLTKALIA